MPSNIHEKTHLQKLLRPAHCASRTGSRPVDCSLLQLRSQKHHRDPQTSARTGRLDRWVERLTQPNLGGYSRSARALRMPSAASLGLFFWGHPAPEVYYGPNQRLRRYLSPFG